MSVHLTDLEIAVERHPYIAGFSMVAVVTAFGFLAAPVLHIANLDVLYLLPVFVTGIVAGRKPATFTAILSAVVFDFCFIPPTFSFHISDLPYLVTLIVFVVVAIATSELAGRARALKGEQVARARAEALNQAKDEILVKVAHELRSPLNAVLGWAQMIEKGHHEPARFSRAVTGIKQSAALVRRLVEDLLNASRLATGKLSVTLQRTDFAPVVADAVVAMEPVAEAQCVRLRAQIEPVGEVLADAERIEQIVTNLISNAIKFTPRDGEVLVKLAREHDGIELTVTDTGVGIDAEFLPHVFERFSQANSAHARHGLGLGLAIVKHLAEAHGGTAVARSRGQGHGAQFVVQFPADAARLTAARHAPTSHPEAV